jgi:hypothetical protein
MQLGNVTSHLVTDYPWKGYYKDLHTYHINMFLKMIYFMNKNFIKHVVM